MKHSTVNIYTDVSDKSLNVIERKLQDDILNYTEWMLANIVKKTQFILIGIAQNLSPCRELCMNVPENFIENIECAKLICVHIHECRIWSSHSDVF